MVKNITTIPAPRVDFIDPRTNLMSREWYRFFLNLFTLVGEGREPIDIEELLILPPTEDVSGIVTAIQSNVDQSLIQSNTSQIAEIDKAIQALATYDQAAYLLAEVADLRNRLQDESLSNQVSELRSTQTEILKQLEALNSEPANTPHLYRRAYGSFYDTTRQTAAVIDTAYPITYNTVVEASGVTIGSPTSRVYVDRAGVYDIQFSAQFDKTSGGVALFQIWLRVNGTDVPYSASRIRIQGNDAEIIPAWNFFHDFNEGDYFEIVWATDSIDVIIETFAASGVYPAVPSVILTVNDNISSIM